MKKIILSLLCTVILFCVANWSKQTSDVAGNQKHRINFYGTVITLGNQDKKTPIDNISIDNIYKQIPVYVAPTTFSQYINPKEHIISADPKDILQSIRIDLAEIKTIETKRIEGNPVMWKYIEKTKGSSEKIRQEYIEIIVISNDNSKNNYLVELRKSLYYNEKSEAGPRESKISFKGLSQLNIEGYTDRELEKRDMLYKNGKTKKGLNGRYKKAIPASR